MSNFQKDVQLLTDLQELISDAERTANMPGYAGAVFNAISPALKAAMPAAQKKARRQIDVLTRAKERLMEQIGRALDVGCRHPGKLHPAAL